MNTLIPDLPEELGLECLVRVPHQTLPLLRRVCRRWKQATESPLFHHRRRSSGKSDPLIIFSQTGNHPLLAAAKSFYRADDRLISFNRSSGDWSPLPPIPFSPRSIPFFCSLAASNLHLVVIGGFDPDTFATSTAVYVYSFLSGTWARGAPMPAPTRFSFACAASANNQVFVAGGRDVKHNALKSAMVYDVAKDEWTMLPGMAREMGQCTGVFVDGKAGGMFIVVGGYWSSMQRRFELSAEVFHLGEWRWGAVEEEALKEGDWSRSCVAGGDQRVFMCGRGGRVVVLKEGEEWREAGELPEDVSMVLKMMGCGVRLILVWMNGCGGDQAAYVLEMKDGTMIGWRQVEVPKEYSGRVHSACCIDV